MKNLLILLLLSASFINITAQTNNNEYLKAQSELNRRGEVYFSFSKNQATRLNDLSHIISLSKINGDQVFAYANASEFNQFLQKNIDYQILTAPSELQSVLMSDDPKQVLTWNYYPTYPAYETIMQQFATDHPEICKMLTISTLASGRKIIGLRISDNVDIQENEPEFLYTSSIHGDETTGYIMMLHLADYLLTNYGTDQRITDMVNNFDICIFPLTNPDGTYHGGNNSVNGATRYNANNVDVNRNFPDPKGGQHPDGNPWQPEAVAFMNFSGINTFTMGANFHGGAEVLNYPWDTWTKLSADDAWWRFVCREYADTVHAHAPAGYLTDLENGITNGNAWYEIEGGRQDYMNYFRYCREVTIECSETKLVPENQLLNFWNYNYRSLLNYIEESGYGLHGLVTDSISGIPLKAKVFINGFDKDSSHIYTDPQVGDYHRLLKSGFYNVTFSAAGYNSKTVQVQINDKQKKTLDIQLYDGRLATYFTADTATPAVDQVVHFTDHSAGQPQAWHWTFSGGNPAYSNEQNPVVTYDTPGKYAVKLVIERPGSTDSLLREEFIEVKPWYLLTDDKTYTVCDSKFYDFGGANQGYSNNENSTITFLPATASEKLTARFKMIDIESSANCENDKLLVYDAENATGTPLASICGNELHGDVTATNPAGALTFKFISNSSITQNGWEVEMWCGTHTAIAESTANDFKIYPNPVADGLINIESTGIINSLIICDLPGRVLYSAQPDNNHFLVELKAPAGIYLVKLRSGNSWIVRKIQIIK